MVFGGIADKRFYQQKIKVERLLLNLKRYECNLTFNKVQKCRCLSKVCSL